MDQIEDLLDEPGDRLPLLTRGEAGALVALLGRLADRDDDQLQRAALELQARLGTRLAMPQARRPARGEAGGMRDVATGTG
ncbi:hypothetical protein ACFVX6_16010 [Streptomyces sp. NPDC058289]|uniref:hypothetical protein n=1 Tax=Streptomyces sp. NPDC058289 TaxID=3346425 RepID=UPI0036EF97D2